MEEDREAETRGWDISLLYVEDEEPALQWISEILKRRVNILYTARNGEEGLRLFQQHTPDIVLTDIRMPVMDGLEMSKAIKALNGNEQIIVISAHDDINYLINAIDLGVSQFILKPIDLDKLFSAIGRCANTVLLERIIQQQNKDREAMILELQDALDRVKKLSGMLPICSSCKRIRDDKGYWNQLEDYISGHSETVFSHSLCPECAKKLYPEYYKG